MQVRGADRWCFQALAVRIHSKPTVRNKLGKDRAGVIWGDVLMPALGGVRVHPWQVNLLQRGHGEVMPI